MPLSTLARNCTAYSSSIKTSIIPALTIQLTPFNVWLFSLREISQALLRLRYPGVLPGLPKRPVHWIRINRHSGPALDASRPRSSCEYPLVSAIELEGKYHPAPVMKTPGRYYRGWQKQRVSQRSLGTLDKTKHVDVIAGKGERAD
ncbi:hypothetical protein BU23DRAFT_72312 [Bimuria novae-zelandiae CBS 107.79]|uniref:Uncharacterized protein n=1 Tax=Bimuria novae-zelandiae CBS 107.79 TaxID=1447943 RepID=A0A6A5UMI0_9PLEO|nr:hypothetical protein BU23DRAFT_72312 [Bimuria novae-zelandiae CBS 107.79]